MILSKPGLNKFGEEMEISVRVAGLTKGTQTDLEIDSVCAIVNGYGEHAVEVPLNIPLTESSDTFIVSVEATGLNGHKKGTDCQITAAVKPYDLLPKGKWTKEGIFTYTYSQKSYKEPIAVGIENFALGTPNSCGGQQNCSGPSVISLTLISKSSKREVSEAQSEILHDAAKSMRDQAVELSKEICDGRTTSEDLFRHYSQADFILESTRSMLLRALEPTDKYQAQLVEDYIGDLTSSLGEIHLGADSARIDSSSHVYPVSFVASGLSQSATKTPNISYSLLRSIVRAWNALSDVEETESLTFDLGLQSCPPGATAEYHLKGYDPKQVRSDTIIHNITKGRVYFDVTSSTQPSRQAHAFLDFWDQSPRYLKTFCGSGRSSTDVEWGSEK